MTLIIKSHMGTAPIFSVAISGDTNRYAHCDWSLRRTISTCGWGGEGMSLSDSSGVCSLSGSSLGVTIGVITSCRDISGGDGG